MFKWCHGDKMEACSVEQDASQATPVELLISCVGGEAVKCGKR
jgi:hypothetical protein